MQACTGVPALAASLYTTLSQAPLLPAPSAPLFQGDRILKTRLLVIHGVIMGRVMAIISQAPLTIAITCVSFFRGSTTVANAVSLDCS